MIKMQLKILNIPWIDGAGFDGSKLIEFCAKEDVVDVGDNFFFHENRPCWTMLIQYRSGNKSTNKKTQKRKDPRAELDSEDKKLYDVLREWRSTKSISDGVPVYLIFDNRQLAEIARLKPETKKALGEIGKVGKSKLDNYSEDLFVILNNYKDNNGK